MQQPPAASQSTSTTTTTNQGYVGVKPFERSLLTLFESLDSQPSRTVHPLLHAGAAELGTDWSALHAKLHPLGAGVPASRADRKAWQLESCIAITALLAQDSAAPAEALAGAHIVDFAGGSGPLGLPLAALLAPAGARVSTLSSPHAVSSYSSSL